MIRKVAVFTSNRAELGLLSPIVTKIENSKLLELQLIIAGTNLRDEQSISDIEKLNISTTYCIDYLDGNHSDKASEISKILSSISIFYKEYKPDILLVLGDRYELIPVVFMASFYRIPIFHMYGGETSEGAIDESVRHSVTKFSHVHLVANEIHKKRIIQLGENSNNIYVVGSMGIENAMNIAIWPRERIIEELGFKENCKNYLVTYHPATLNPDEQGMEAISSLVENETNSFFLFSAANPDPGGDLINQKIQEICNRYPEKTRFIANLGVERYINAVRNSNAVIGNSSSGLIEVSALKVPTINIGIRQRGRLAADSVISCNASYLDISKAMKTIENESFKMKLQNVTCPYGDGNTSNQIIDILCQFNLDNILIKKFHDK